MASSETSEPSTPDVGSRALDIKRRRVGVVIDVIGSLVWLRPQKGGVEWVAKAEHVRPAGILDELRPRVREANHLSRRNSR